MRILTISSVFFFVFGAVLIAQQYEVQPLPLQPPQLAEVTQDGDVQPFITTLSLDGRPLRLQQDGGQPGAQPSQWQDGGAPWQQGAPGQVPLGQGPPARLGMQPGGMNADQTTRMIARLKALDANGDGVLEPQEIPANQQARVNTMITQLGGNPNGPVNLADLERRALAMAGNNMPPNQPAAPNGGRQRQQPPVEPLVRPFGETKTADTPVLGFGQRPVVAPSSPGAGRQQREMGAAQANLAEVQAARNANAIKQSTPYDGYGFSPELRTGTFSWFFEYDTNQDGQLTMQEYVAGRGGIWTQGIATEFCQLDRNGDGFITVDEALTTIKEWDEKAAQETKDQPATPPPPQPGRQGGQIRRLPTANPGQTGPSSRGSDAGNQGRQIPSRRVSQQNVVPSGDRGGN